MQAFQSFKSINLQIPQQSREGEAIGKHVTQQLSPEIQHNEGTPAGGLSFSHMKHKRTIRKLSRETIPYTE